MPTNWLSTWPRIYKKDTANKYCMLVSLDMKHGFSWSNWSLMRKSLAAVGVPQDSVLAQVLYNVVYIDVLGLPVPHRTDRVR